MALGRQRVKANLCYPLCALLCVEMPLTRAKLLRLLQKIAKVSFAFHYFGPSCGNVAYPVPFARRKWTWKWNVIEFNYNFALSNVRHCSFIAVLVYLA